MPPSVGGDSSLTTFQDLSFIDSSAQQVLEAHIKKFRMRMEWGLPCRVLESIEIFNVKGAASQSLSHSHLPSSTNPIPEVDSKSVGFELLRGSSNSPHGEEVGTTNSAPVLDHLRPATSPVGKERQGSFRQSTSGINQELAEDIQRSKGARQTLLPVRHGITDKASQRQTPLGKRRPQNLPVRQAGAGQEPKDKSVSSKDRREMRQGKKMEERSEPFPVCNVSREIFRAKELDALQSKTGDILTTGKLGSPQKINGKESNVETTERPPPKRPVPKDPKSSDVFGELKFKLERREQSQVQSQPTDRSLASESLTYKALLTRA